MASTDVVLKRLYETKDFADVSIGTRTKIFRVHKAVVCTQSSFFRAALAGKFKEAKTGHVDVEEHEEIIDSLLHHMYRLEAPVLSSGLGVRVPRASREDLTESAEGRIRKLLHLQAAADKYDVDGLTGLCSAAIVRWLPQVQPPKSLTKIGSLLWDHGLASDHTAREKLVELTCKNGPAILYDHNAWIALHSCEGYCKAVMRCAASLL